MKPVLFCMAALLLGLVNQAQDLVKGMLGDHRAHKVLELVRRAQADALGGAHELVLHAALPERLGHVQARQRTALLALVLERGADALRHHRIHVRRGVHKVEVLATRLADNAGVALVQVEVVRDLLPERAEHEGRAGKVQTRKVAVVDRRVRHRRRIAGDELDHTVRHAGLLEDLEHDVVRVDGHRRRLPHDDIADQRRRHHQVASNRREVERRHSKHKALERAILSAVPHARRVARRLDGVHVVDVLHTEAQKVADLRTGINLSLPHVLALADHRRGKQLVAVLVRDQVRGLEADGGTLAPRHVRPDLLGLERTLDRRVDHGLVGLVVVAQHLLVVTGVHLLALLARGELAAIDNDGHLLGARRNQLINRLLQLSTVDRVRLKVALSKFTLNKQHTMGSLRISGR